VAFILEGMHAMPTEEDNAKKLHTPHDSGFKGAMSDVRVACEFFTSYLPDDVQQRIDFNTLEMQNCSFIDKELHKTASDVLYRVHLKDEQKSAAYLYILVEAQTNPDKWLPFRMLGYILQILERHRQQKINDENFLPIVWPVIFYTGTKKYTYPVDIPSLFYDRELAMHMLTGEYKFIDLQKTEDDLLLQHRWTGLMEMFMKHARDRDALSLLQSTLSVFIEPLLQQKANKYVASILKYLVAMGEVSDVDSFIAFLKTQVSEPFPKVG